MATHTPSYASTVVTPAREYVHVADDPAIRGVLLFGGTAENPGSASTVLNDTWLWDAHGWRRIETMSAPPLTAPVDSMTYDSTHHAIVLVTAPSNDTTAQTWMFTGSNWIEQSEASTPPLTNMLVADAPEVGGLIAFGGVESYQGATPIYSTKLWRWDGAKWQAVSVSGSAPGADEADFGLMTADSASRSVILVNQKTGGIWRWNGSAWLHYQSENAPPMYANVALTYDDTLKSPVLVASGAIGSYVWVLNGETWVKHSSAGTPTIQSITRGSITYDHEREAVFVYSAQLAPTPSDSPSAYVSATWLWANDQWIAV